MGFYPTDSLPGSLESETKRKFSESFMKLARQANKIFTPGMDQPMPEYESIYDEVGEYLQNSINNLDFGRNDDCRFYLETQCGVNQLLHLILWMYGFTRGLDGKIKRKEFSDAT